MLCQAFNAPLGAEPVTRPSRAHANHHFSGGFDYIGSQAAQTYMRYQNERIFRMAERKQDQH